MQRVSRLKFLIFATIACAILFCIAAFSVSFAEWDIGEDNPIVAVQGNAGKFYVEYPQYISSTGSDVAIPALDDNKYYLQVPHHDNADISDYYEMWENEATKNSNNPEKMVTNVRLYKNGTFSVYKGTTQLIIANDNNSTTNVTFENKSGTEAVNGIYTVNADGYYNFNFDYAWDPWNKMKVSYAGAISSGNTGGTVDTSDYPYNVTFTFSEGTPVKFYFKTDASAGTGYNDLASSYMHIWSPDNNFYIKDKNNQTVALGAKSSSHFMFGHIYGGSQWYDYQSSQYSFSDYTSAEYLITLHKIKNGDIEKEVGGSGGNIITPATPDETGTTDINGSRVTNDRAEVRKVAAVIQKENNKYVYKNYICVSRKNSEATTDDNSIAYLEFRVTGYNVDPYNIIIKSLKLTRRATDERGNIMDSFIEPAPRIYNFDPTVETRLGPAESHTAPDPDNSEGRYPIFAHGNQHIVTDSDANLEGEDKYANMQNHYDDGVYVVLYFGDRDQQYFALDLEIEFELDSTVTAPTDGVKFTLIADANNLNSWERYADKYGEPWGFYMGGLINSVKTWDPSRTTKLERASDKNKVKYDPEKESEIVTDIDDSSATTTSQIATFNRNSTFNYKIIEFWDDEGNREGYARYPKGKIDVSLTVNLTQGSKIKIYMLDNVGSRLDIEDESGNVIQRNRTIYIVPNDIVYDSETKKLFPENPDYDIYDKELNIIIPKTGTYMFRLTGYFHTDDDDIVDSEGITRSGSWFKYKDGKRYDSLATSQGCELPNFNLIVDTLYITCASAGKSTCDITLHGNGGTFDGAETLTRTVAFGSDVTKLPKPTHPDGKTLLGWYYKDSAEEWQEFEFGNTVTDDMDLYARWAEVHAVTFDPNGGDLPEGASDTAQTDINGNLSDEQLSAVEPTYSGYKFKGWYTALTGGIKITTDYTFTKSRTVYARWEESDRYKITFNLNGMPFATAPTQQSVPEGETATLPTVTVEHYTIVSWHTASSCTAANIYDFDTPVTAPKTLYAKWYAENGVYANDVYVGELTANPKTGVTSTRLMAKNLKLPANATVKFWYDQKQVKSNMFVRSGCPAQKAITPLTTANSSGTLTVATEDYYSLYYEDNNGTGGTERGIWITYGGELKNPNVAPEDGVYNSTTLAIAFEAHTAVNQVKAMRYEVTTDNTILTVKFNGYNRIPTTVPSTAENPHVFASAGVLTGLKLNKGVYDFYYNYVDNAMWIDGYYKVTLNATDGAFTDNNKTKTLTTGKVTANGGVLAADDISVEPSKDGYRFIGWYTAQTDGSKVNLSTNRFTGNTTLYAQWKQTVFAISFDKNDGTGTIFDTCNTDNTGHLTSLPEGPERIGFAFGGWYTSSAVDAGEDDEVTVDTEFTRNTTVYAKWQYTVTFYANGGTWSDGSDPHTQQVNQGGTAEALSAPENAPTTDETFDGWYTAADDTGSKFVFTTAINANIDLFAHWVDSSTATYTITFNANGGTVTPASATTDTSGMLSELPTPTRDLYKFVGWYDTSAATGGTKIETSKVYNGDTTIHARWTPAKITFEFNGPNWSPSIKDVKISAVGEKGNYSQVSMTGTAPNYTHTFTLNATNGNIIGVKVQFNQGTNGWTAYSTKGYADFVAGETYTIEYSDWDNPDWDNNIATYSVTITDSDGNTVTQKDQDVIHIQFSSNRKATLTIRYNNVNASKRGIHYFNCSDQSSSPELLWGVTSISDTDDNCTFILTNTVGGWGGNQTDDLKCTYSAGASSTFTATVKNNDSTVVAYIDVVNATIATV